MKEYHRGEIYWIDAKGAEGHEIYGDRPCVIVSSEIINKHTGCVIVVPTTSNDKNNIQHRLALIAQGNLPQLFVSKFELQIKAG